MAICCRGMRFAVGVVCIDRNVSPGVNRVATDKRCHGILRRQELKLNAVLLFAGGCRYMNAAVPGGDVYARQFYSLLVPRIV